MLTDTFRHRRLGALLGPLLVVASANPSAAETTTKASPPSSAQASIPFERYRLDNGLTVILSQDPGLPRVAVNVWYHVGPVNEPPGRSGFAHLFEHLMFEGSRHVGRRFDQLMEGMGASNVNGTTNWDRTNYYETVPSEHLETALWIESDRMAFMELSPARLEAQRDIVKNERRQSFENSPYGKSDLALLDAVFPKGHPYHGAVIGSMQDLSRAEMKDVDRFYRTYYAPNNATLTLVGSFEPEKTKQLIAKYFGSLQAREVPQTKREPTPALSAPLHQTVREDVELARVALAYIAPPAYSPADASLRVLAAVLAGGKATRLYRRLVVEQKLATQVEAWVDPNQLCTLVGVTAKARSGVDTNLLERELRTTLRLLASEGPSERELTRAKKRLLVSLFATLEHLNGGDGESGRAGLLQRFNHYLKDPGYLPAWTATLEKVTAADVQGAAQKWLSDAQSATVITLPTQKSSDSQTGRASSES